MLVKSLQKESSFGERCLDKLSKLQIRPIFKPKEDWWDTISEYERQGILQGLAESEAGLGIPHEEVMKEYEKWL